MPAKMAQFFRLLGRVLAVFYQHGGMGTAKAAAYSALLSFIPILTALATLLVQINAQKVSERIAEYVFVAVPPGAQEFVEYSFTARGERPALLLVAATMLSLWAASGLMTTLMDGFQAAYRLPSSRPLLRQRSTAVLLVFIAAAPVVLGSAFIVLGNRVERWVLVALGLVPGFDPIRGGVLLAGLAMRHLIAIGSILLAAAGLYYFGPDRPQRWRFVWPGAVLATALWLAATIGFAWYVRNIATYNVMYGGLGAVIALMVWMYVLSVVALIGCEFNAERERALGGRPD